MLIKVKDGGLIDISEDKDYTSGCETCDYGSEYVNSFELKLTTIKIYIEASQMYEYPLSEGHMMKVLLPNVEVIKEMTEIDFANWLENELKKEVDDITFDIIEL